MLNDIKKMLLDKPEIIKSILEYFDFSNVSIHTNEIRCGFDDNHNRNSIRIKLLKNENLFVKDFGRNTNYDLITFIIKTRKIPFIDVLNVIKSNLGITDFYNFSQKRSVFGGFYDRIKNKSHNIYIETYDESILNQYELVYNTRFAKDNIDFNTQLYFNLRYDIVSQRIIIPIYDAYGSLIGIKGRANWEICEDESKYLYLIPCAISNTLYGYSQNYEFLTNNTIYVFESEKSIMQCFSYGIKNCVSIGGNSLSTQQCKLLMELNPQKIVFMFDEGLDMSIIEANINKLKTFCKLFDTSIGYWDYTIDRTIPKKSSPSDLGKQRLLEIIKTQLKDVIS